MVMVLRATANVRRAALAGEGVERSGAAQELERPVRGCEPEARRRSTCALEELDRREGAAQVLDRVQDRAALWCQTGARGQHQAPVRCLIGVRSVRQGRGLYLKVILTLMSG